MKLTPSQQLELWKQDQAWREIRTQKINKKKKYKYNPPIIPNSTNIPIFHVDGGAFLENPGHDQKFVRAYFSVLDDKNNLIHFEKNLGDMWSGLAEFHAIRWVIENIKKRPLKVTSDCTTAISWAKKGGNKKTKKMFVPPIDHTLLEGVIIEYKHENYADIFNATTWSPKHSKKYYYEKWLENQKT